MRVLEPHVKFSIGLSLPGIVNNGYSVDADTAYRLYRVQRSLNSYGKCIWFSFECPCRLSHEEPQVSCPIACRLILRRIWRRMPWTLPFICGSCWGASTGSPDSCCGIELGTACWEMVLSASMTVLSPSRLGRASIGVCL